MLKEWIVLSRVLNKIADALDKQNKLLEQLSIQMGAGGELVSFEDDYETDESDVFETDDEELFRAELKERLRMRGYKL